MILNKRGWGLREMLIWSGILLVFLIIAIYYIYNLYSSIDQELLTNTYTNLENNLERQADIYLENYYDGELTDDNMTITKSVLKSYDLDISLKDDDGNLCSGYVMANKNEVKGYISCRDYTTDGYESWRS